MPRTATRSRCWSGKSAPDAVLETVTPIDNLRPPVTSTWANHGPFAIPAAAGKNVYLEFRFQGTDNSYIGLYIDDVLITAP